MKYELPLKIFLSCWFATNAILTTAHAAPPAKLNTSTVRYKIDSQEFANYLVYDESTKTPRPGILIAPEIWGLSDFEKNYANRLAEQGFTVMVVDLYGGGFATKDLTDAKKHMDAVQADGKTLSTRFMRAYDELEKQPTVKASDIGAIGFGFGGGLVVDEARSGVTLKAAVDYYGGLVSPAEKKASKYKVHPEILVLAGDDDTYLDKEQINAFNQEMKDAKAKAKVVLFPGTLHDFARPDADEFHKKYDLPCAFNSKAEKSAWEQTLSLLKAKLKAETPKPDPSGKTVKKSVE